MIMDELVFKTIGLVGATIGMYVPLAQIPVDDGTLGIVREYGSLGLLVILVLGFLWILKGLSPIVVGMLQKSVDGFLAELSKQREAREQADIRHIQAIEKFRDDFREMLGSHKNAIVESITKQGEAVEKLTDELSKRPCQK